MALATLCKKARNLPDEVKERIWYFSPPPHPTATLIKRLQFEYRDTAYEPLSRVLQVTVCDMTRDRWVHRYEQKYYRLPRFLKHFWICRSIYNPIFTDLPDWVVQEARSPGQRKNLDEQ